jgi:L-ascorbate metabolism protein UlaG (beta-lactamase superfamily)
LLAGCGGHLARPDEVLFPDPPPNAITFWGHACAYVDLDGFGIVTDPVFEETAPFRWRKVGAPPPPAYRNARVVLLSHAHGDHLSPRTLATFPQECVILCPEPCAHHLREIGRRIEVMRPGDTFEIPGGKITAVVAKHAGDRRGLFPSDEGDALGWVIEAPAVTIFWSGDTNWFPGFDDVGTRFRPDVTLLNISGHLHGMEAVRAAWASRARTIVPMHFGAYGYFFFAEPKKPRDWEVMQKHLGEQLVLLGLGESLALPGPRRSGP